LNIVILYIAPILYLKILNVTLTPKVRCQVMFTLLEQLHTVLARQVKSLEVTEKKHTPK